MNHLEDKIEEAFWSFDGRRKGYGEFKNRPQSERDAFKTILRNFVNLEPQFSEPLDFLFTTNHPRLSNILPMQKETLHCKICNEQLSDISPYSFKKCCKNPNCF